MHKDTLQRFITFTFLVFALFGVSQISLAVSYSHPVTPSLTNVADNTWVKIDQGSVTSPANIMSYSGGWYDTQNHQFCLFGGGHWDYSGNEVWCLDIATLNWQEVYAPDVVTTQSGNQGAYNNYDNNNYPGALFKPAGESIQNANPMSRHSYDQMEYVEGLGPVVWGGYFWGDGVGTDWCDMCDDTWAFNYTTGKWQYLYDGSNPSPNVTAGVGASAYSSTNNLMYSVVQGNTWTFNPVNNRWTQINASGPAPYSIENTMEYDSKRNVLYTFGGTYPNNPVLHKFDIATSTWTRLTPSGSGPGTNTVHGPGVAYDEANDVLLVYKRGNIWAYNPNNNSWTQYSPAVRPPVSGYSVWGRFRYDPINKGFWYHNWESGQHTTWFYRFSNSGTLPPSDVGPSVTFDANPLAIAPSEQTVLTWTSNADSCTASGDWSDNISANSTATKTLTNTSTFALTCSTNAGQTTRYVTVQVSSANEPPPPNGDTDTDGLPDSWEQQYFGDLMSDGNDDNDQDGYSNWVEYNAGTDPTVWDEPAGGGSGGGGSGNGSGGGTPGGSINNNNDVGSGSLDILALLLLASIALYRIRQTRVAPYQQASFKK